MPSIQTLAETLRSLAASGMKQKELMAAVRQKHPEASKKEIVRAAFYALTEGHAGSADGMHDLHAFALNERVEDGSADRPVVMPRKKKKHRKEQRAEPAPH